MNMPNRPVSRNDSPFLDNEVRTYLNQHGVHIRYRDFNLLMDEGRVEEGRREVAALPADQRPTVLASLIQALNLNIAMLTPNSPKTAMDTVADDLVLWYALTELMETAP